jgi:hypothetical protein
MVENCINHIKKIISSFNLRNEFALINDSIHFLYFTNFFFFLIISASDSATLGDFCNTQLMQYFTKDKKIYWIMIL